MSSGSSSSSASSSSANNSRCCELCQGEASIYCLADEAFICWECDAKVHAANFLVARHTRLVLCKGCQAPGRILSSGLSRKRCLCSSCSSGSCASEDEDDDGFTHSADFSSTEPISSSSSSSSDEDDEISTSRLTLAQPRLKSSSLPGQRAAKVRRSRSPASVLQATNWHFRRRLETPITCFAHRNAAEERVEVMLRRWSSELGLANAARIVPVAMYFLRGITKVRRGYTRLDARATIAACFWAAIKLQWSSSSLLSRLERCTGVPAQVLVEVELKLRPAFVSG